MGLNNIMQLKTILCTYSAWLSEKSNMLFPRRGLLQVFKTCLFLLDDTWNVTCFILMAYHLIQTDFLPRMFNFHLILRASAYQKVGLSISYLSCQGVIHYSVVNFLQRKLCGRMRSMLILCSVIYKYSEICFTTSCCI